MKSKPNINVGKKSSPETFMSEKKNIKNNTTVP